MWSHPHSPELNANEATADLKAASASSDKAADLKRYHEEEATRSPLQEAGEGKDADYIPVATESSKSTPFRLSQRSSEKSPQ